MNAIALNNLFKPYTLKFQNGAIFNEITNEKTIMTLIIEMECSKSVNETCANVNCDYNCIDVHTDELYKQLINDGDA